MPPFSPDYCVECCEEVGKKHVLSCDVCTFKVHRTCNTGVSQRDYYRMKKGLIIIPFVCIPCRNKTTQEAETRHIEEMDTTINQDDSSLDKSGRPPPVLEVSVPVTNRDAPISPPLLEVSVPMTHDDFDVTSRSDETLQRDDEAKEVAVHNIFRPALGIVEEVMTDIKEQLPSSISNPSMELIARQANRIRQRMRPDEPKDMQFELAEGFMPELFYRGEVRVGDQRHLVFATDNQLALLKQAKRWYIDGTFKVVREPFKQLLTVHAFVRSGDQAKCVPLIYVLMSRRQKIDYVKVLKKIGRLLDREPSVDGIVVDFEVGMWEAVKEVLPGVVIHGCAFHWTKAVWRKVQTLGLSTEYREKGSTHRFVRKLLALPFIPAEHATETFEMLQELASDHLQPLTDYIHRVWFSSSVWARQLVCVRSVCAHEQ